MMMMIMMIMMMMMMVMIAVPVFAGRKTQHFGVFSVKVYHISVYLQI